MSQQKIKEFLNGRWVLVILFVIASVVECTVIFPVMTHNYINYDSSYQYALMQHSLPEIFELLPYDYSPPFYATALKLWTMVFGNSLTVMRAFSMVAVVGMFFVAAFPVRTLFGNWSAGICLVITFCSTVLFDLLHEIRPTIFAMFFFMAAAVYAVLAYSQQKRYSYICMTVFSVLCMYTHNIALVGMFCVYVVLLAVCLIRKEYKKLKYFLISGGISAVLYIPWLSVILNQIKNVNDHFWTASYGGTDVITWIVYDIFRSKSGFLVTVLNFLLLMSVFMVLIRHIDIKKLKGAKKFKDVIRIPEEKSEYMSIFLLFLFVLVTCLFLAAIDLFYRRLSSQRYYAIISMIWIVCFSALLGSFGSRIANLALSVVLVFVLYGNVQATIQDIEYADKNNMVADVSELFPEGDIAFLHTHEWSLGVMSYYFPDATHYVCDEMFTVLGTYDVFPVNVVDIGTCTNIMQYTDKCVVLTNEWEVITDDGEEFRNDDILDILSNEYELVPLNTYRCAYYVAFKSFDIACMFVN